MILLTDEEIEELTKPMIMIDPEVIAKAQLKKVGEHLGKNGGLFVDRFDKKRFQMDYNVWQALLKEVEGE